MNFILILLVISALLFQYIQAIAIRMSSDDLLIKAHITHKQSNNTWYFAETVHLKPTIHGIIKVQKGDIEMHVHYNLNTSQRIVFLEAIFPRPMEMKSMLNFTWFTARLPESTIRLINKLLMFGLGNCFPFLLHFSDHNYQLNEKERSLTCMINDPEYSFFVYKFSEDINPSVAFKKLANITISNSGNDPAITMKIDKIVSLNSVVVETGQQFYVGFNESLTDHIHDSTVNIQFNSTKDTVIPISWIKYARQEINYKEVDDLGSNSSFTSTTNGCAIQSSNQNESFNFASLSFQEFFGKAWIFKYTYEILFPIKYQHGDQITTHKMEFNKQIGNFSYDLVITTLKVARTATYFTERMTYFTIFKPRNISSDLILQNLQVERKLYNKENKSSLEYRLLKTQKTCFSGYTKLNYEPGHQASALNNKGFQDARMDVLTLRLSPSKKLSTMETFTLLEKLDELGENLKDLICLKLGISNLRIKSVQMQFHTNYLLASVVIIERLNIVDLLMHRKLDSSELVNYLYSDIETCLKLEAKKSNFSKIISCNDISHGCIGITLDQPLPEQNEDTSNAVIYNNLDKVLYKLVQEPSLRELKMSYKLLNQATLGSIKLNFDLHLDDSSQNDSHSTIKTGSFNEKVGSKNYFGQYVFFILIVAIICAVIGFAAIFSKLYRRNVPISSSSSISLTIFKDS